MPDEQKQRKESKKNVSCIVRRCFQAERVYDEKEGNGILYRANSSMALSISNFKADYNCNSFKADQLFKIYTLANGDQFSGDYSISRRKKEEDIRV